MTARPALEVLLRSVVLLAVDASFVFWLHVPGDDDGLGTGLLAFAVLALLAAVWGAVDGYRTPLNRVLVVWPVVSLVYAVVSVVLSDLGASADIFWSDLVAVGPVALFLVLVPALFTGVVVGAVRSASSRH